MPYISGIDLLRFLGAISVVGLHLGLAAPFVRHGLENYYRLISGSTGIMLFYVISGFLITSIILSEIKSTGNFNIKSFFIRRALRIFPLYYFALAMYFIVAMAGWRSMNYDSFLYALFYAYNFVPRSLYNGWLGSFHTLATEEHFYVLYPLLWAFCIWRKQPAWLFLVLALVITTVTPALTAPYRDDFLTHLWTFNAWAPIIFGCLFGYYYSTDQSKIHLGRSYFLVIFLVIYLMQILVPTAYGFSVAFGFLILHLAYNQQSWTVRLIGSKPIRYLGSISYGLYVWQSFIIGTGKSNSLIHDPLLAVAAIFGLSVLSWHLIEKPLSRIRRHMRPSSDGRVVSAPQLRPPFLELANPAVPVKQAEIG